MDDTIKVAVDLAMQYAVKNTDDVKTLATNFAIALKKLSYNLSEIEVSLSELKAKVKE